MRRRLRDSAKRRGGETLLDPIAAYDLIASEYSSISQRRRAYLDGVEQLVIGSVPAGSRSMLDVGAGDGIRAQRIAKAAGIRDLMLLEPSVGMRALWRQPFHAWPIRAEQLESKEGSFDIITCLWNVLGQIFPEAGRVEALRQIARLLSPSGLAFLDVNHRHDIRHYGLFLRTEKGDVPVRWTKDGKVCLTKGHVFTHSEMKRLMARAGLFIRRTISVDYGTGEVRRFKLSGNLLYVLSRGTLIAGNSELS